MLCHVVTANEAFADIGQLLPRKTSNIPQKRQIQGINYNKNGSAFVWVPQDTYQGKNFFDGFNFFTGDDPTRYVSREVALQKNYTWVEDDGTARIVADMKSWLPYNTPRESIRINTKKMYTTGLFIIDLNRAPYGCAVWPAFWSTSIPRSNLPQDAWPNYGEIDILEGVHDQHTNRMAWHTKAGCSIDTKTQFTGNVSTGPSGEPHTDCESNGSTKGGCGIADWSKASYGEFFESQGGGVLAMKWDENDISVWSFFRAAIPDDIKQGIPTPASWGPPSARLDSSKCDIPNYFSNHTVIINITFCGDWAGNTYATTECPGTCVERMMDPANFVNATWSINSFKVYQKQPLNGDFKPSSAGTSFRTYGMDVVTLLGTSIMAGIILSL
ncbi:family 16 glycosyl hydrolase [Panaeolus papilionaceus]|nr:family 16 glycosyl hydrolase [Panaeolus papilionaceus]